MRSLVYRRYEKKFKDSNAPGGPDNAGVLDYPRFVYTLFLGFSLYLTIPLIEVPLLGLSISAPIFFMIALPVVFQSQIPWFGRYQRWIFAALFIWLGIFISAIINGLASGGEKVDGDTAIGLIQFAYWVLVFVVTTYLVSSQKNLTDRLMNILAFGIAFLGFLRLGEAVFGGAIGAWTRLEFMSQNGYAIQFSMFFPLLLSFSFQDKKVKRARLAAFLVLAAILINGSRGGWIAVLVSTAVFFIMYLITQRQYSRTVSTLLIFSGMVWGGIVFAPQAVVVAFQDRLSTVERLEEDKSYAIRQLMIQRGLRLFQNNPLIGVGISRWYKESVPLQIPRILQYETQDYFEKKSSHNSYVSYLAENGVIGSAPLAFFLLLLLLGGFRSALRLARRGMLWALGAYAGFIGMSIHLWGLAGLTGTSTWFIYGLVAAIIEIDRQTGKQEELENKNAPRLSLSRPRRF